MTDYNDPNAVSVSDYAGVVARRWWIIALFVLAGTAAALLYSTTVTPKYTSVVQVWVKPITTDPLAASADTDLVNMTTQREIASSIRVADRAKAILGVEGSSKALLDDVTVSIVTDSAILRISYTHANPNDAKAAAEAFATSYLNFRQSATTSDVEEGRSQRADRISAIQDELQELSATRAGLDANSPEATDLGIEITELQAESSKLRVELGSLTALIVDPGEIIDDPPPPSSPSSPNKPALLVAGFGLGLLLGIAVAFVTDRLDDSIGSQSDVLNRVGLRVLATVPRSGGRGSGSLAEADGEVAEAHRRLRSNVLFLNDTADVKVMLVTSANSPEQATRVAGNLAVSSARSGKRVLLISASLRSSALHSMFGLANTVGLSSVLNGDSSVEDAILDWQGLDHLGILPAGPTPSQPAELLQTSAFEELLGDQERHWDLIIVEGPPVLAYSDSLAIAPSTDGVLLVVDSDATTRSAVLQATQQLRQVGGNLLGATLVNAKPSRTGSRMAELAAGSPTPRSAARRETSDD